MVRSPLLVLLGAAIAWAAPASSAWALPGGLGLSARQEAEINNGQVVVKFSDTSSAEMKDILAIGYVDAAPQEVWKVLTDYDHYAEIFPNILKSEIRSRRGNVADQYVMCDYPWPFPDKWVLTENVHDQADWTIKWHRIDGDIAQVVGSWHLYPEKGRTLAVYATRFDPGLAFVPHWVIEWGSSRVVPDIVKNVRKHVRH